MPWVGFETTIPAFERAKTVHASDRSATVTGKMIITNSKSERDDKIQVDKNSKDVRCEDVDWPRIGSSSLLL
jgi:hypothetical protein